MGTSCQSYVYSAYGQVAASDPNFIANPYMFTGRRFDYETGLYYYRARYYNPYIGRFLQTDPIGYGAGINWYAYCGNNPLVFVDPSGLSVTDGTDIPIYIINDPEEVNMPKIVTSYSLWEDFLDIFVVESIAGGFGAKFNF